MKKLLAMMLTLMVGMMFVTGCGGNDDGGTIVDGDMLVIGTLQGLDHPAMDEARAGFISGLADEGFVDGENITFLPAFSAQGNADTAASMAQRIVADGVDMVLGIGTSASQALMRATGTIPIMITAVTDPLQAGLVDTFERPGRNISGTSDLTPVKSQFELMVEILPDVQSVGIIFNIGEINSVIQAEMAQEAAVALGLEYVIMTVTGTADVAQAAQSLARQVDVIYIPTCNTIAATYATVIMAADGAGIPVIVGERAGVVAGALATTGINYYELGRQTAVMAAQVLRGEATPQEMPIQWQDGNDITINAGAAARLGVTIPDDILELAEIVE